MKLPNLPSFKIDTQNISKIPEEAGVYIFFSDNKPLYVGKSRSLRERVKSYINSTLLPKTEKMMNEANSFSYVQVSSELEALLLEAKLVRLLQTPYNIQLKDDKHPLYIRITKAKYPQVLTARKINQSDPNLAFFGPFPASGSVKSTLSLLRRIFPYAQHKPGKRACIYKQIGLCDPCPSEIENEIQKEVKEAERKIYLKNIKLIKRFLEGDLTSVKNILTKQMMEKSRSENFEAASQIKAQIARLEYITAPRTPTEKFLENPNLLEDMRREELISLNAFLAKYIRIPDLTRIECYDVAHLAGSKPTASMVTFVDATPEKSYYRHFKVRQKKGNDDVASLREIAKRRVNHLSTWGVPDLIIVDGGKGQASAFFEEFEKVGVPVIGLAKRDETFVIPKRVDGKITFILIRVPPGSILNFVQRIRDEAHRFARRLHHKLIAREFFKN